MSALRRFAIVLAICCTVLLAAEFGTRWAVEGGFGAALESFQSGGLARPFEGSRDGLSFDAELGYRPDPNAAGMNSLEVMDPAKVAAKSPGVARILLLGGGPPHMPTRSEGRAYHFVVLLRKALGGRAEVLDASVPGYTTRQERLWFERGLHELKPDLLIVAYALDDNHAILYRLDPGWGLVVREQARRDLLPARNGTARWFGTHSYLALRFQLGVRDWRTPANERFPWDFDATIGPAWRDESWKESANELALLKTAAERIGAGLLMVIFPIADQFDPLVIERDARYVFKPQITALEAANSLHIPALDLAADFQRQDGRTLFEPDGFALNDRGQVLVADTLRKWIVESGLLPESKP